MESKIKNKFCFFIIILFLRIIGSTRAGVSWARTRTFGGRNRGGRGYPYGSSRNGGSSRYRSR